MTVEADLNLSELKLDGNQAIVKEGSEVVPIKEARRPKHGIHFITFASTNLRLVFHE